MRIKKLSPYPTNLRLMTLIEIREIDCCALWHHDLIRDVSIYRHVFVRHPGPVPSAAQGSQDDWRGQQLLHLLPALLGLCADGIFFVSLHVLSVAVQHREQDHGQRVAMEEAAAEWQLGHHGHGSQREV